MVLLSAIGGSVKTLGAILYGPRSLFVDAHTCIANVVALAFSIRHMHIGIAPPDRDHPYRHHRLALGDSFATIVTYSFVASVAIMKLLDISPYSVGIGAPRSCYRRFHGLSRRCSSR